MTAATRARRLPQLIGQPWAWLTIALVLTVVGFWPSFFGALRSNSAPHLVHGFTATAWMVAVPLQAWFVTHRRQALHRRLGRWLLLLAPVVVVSGFQIVQVMLLRNHEEMRLVRFKFAFLDTGVLMLFLICIVLGIAAARRRQIALHLRWMACTAILALEPALERLAMTLFPELIPTFDAALHVALFSVEALLLVLIAREWRRGQVYLPYPLLLAFFVLIHILAGPVASNEAFQAFAMRVAGP